MKKVFEIKQEGTLKNKAKAVKTIVQESIRTVIEDNECHMFAGGVALHQGLKYKGSFKQGAKGAFATYGTLIAINSVQNIVTNFDVIRKA